MKVAIVCAFDTYVDRLLLLKEYYESKGYEVIVYGSSFSHRHKEKIQKPDYMDVMIPARPYQKNLSVARLLSHYAFSKQVGTYLKKQRYDLIHVLVPCNSLVKFISPIKHLFPNTKLIYDIIDLWPETMPLSKFKNIFPFTIWKNLRDKTLNEADLILTECGLFQEVLARQKDPKFQTLYWARKERPLPRNVKLDPQRVSFCYLGSINHIIDIDFIVDLLKACKTYKEVTLHLIGDGESKEDLIKNIQEQGIKVVDHGKVFDQKEKQAIFDQCNFGLNVMKKHVVVGLTMKSLDYMCGQLPIINTIQGDTQKFCERFNIGYHVSDVQDPELINKICQQSETDNQQQRDNIQNLYLSYFTKKSFYKTLDQLMEEIS